jgi:sugar lactone lactonase YvrE
MGVETLLKRIICVLLIIVSLEMWLSSKPVNAETGSWSQWGKIGGVKGTGLGEFSNPLGVTVDNNGNVYVADCGNNRIQKLSISSNTWSQWGKIGGASGTGLGEFDGPSSVAVDSSGNMYVAESHNWRIQKLTASTNTWSVVTSKVGYGLGEFEGPGNVAIDSNDNLYVVDIGNNRIQKLNVTTNTWSQLGGKEGGVSGKGLGEFNIPEGITVDSSGNVYVADMGNNRIQKLNVATNTWSQWGLAGCRQGSKLGEFNYPAGVAIDKAGNMYVSDVNNWRIQELSQSTNTWSEDGGLYGIALYKFDYPSGVAIDNSGNVYVADAGNNRIKKLTISNVRIAVDTTLLAKKNAEATSLLNSRLVGIANGNESQNQHDALESEISATTKLINSDTASQTDIDTQLEELMAVMVMFNFSDKHSSISLIVTQDDGATMVSGLTPKLYDINDNEVTGDITISIDVPGTYTFNNIHTLGTYKVVLSGANGDSITISFNVNKFGEIPIVKKATWVTKDTINSKTSGVIGGLALDRDGKGLAGVVVKAYNTKGSWQTLSDKNGAYKIYLPIGSYTLVIVGADTTTGTPIDYKNISTTVKVIAGQMTGPMDDQNAQTTWINDATTFGYTLDGIDSDKKTITGMANTDCIVYAYSVDSGYYTFLSSSNVLGKVGGVGTFKITLPDYQPGKRISIKVIDSAFNIYEDTTYLSNAVSNRTMTMLPSTPSKLIATIVTPTIISFSDSKNKTMNNYLTSNITKVSAVTVEAFPQTIELINNIDYTIKLGKITILAGRLPIASDYNIVVEANGYDTATITQTITASLTAPDTFKTTDRFITSPGSTTGTTKFTGLNYEEADNKLVYIISNKDSALQYKGNVINGDIKDLLINEEISGVDLINNKYIDIYAIDSNNSIVKFKRVTLTAANIAK